MHYDYLIVGAGLFGAVFAHEMTKEGKEMSHVVERERSYRGNIYCETVDDIHVHKYGAHIFHTSNKKYGTISAHLRSLIIILILGRII